MLGDLEARTLTTRPPHLLRNKSELLCVVKLSPLPPGQVATPSGQLPPPDATRRPKIWHFYQFTGLGMNLLSNRLFLHFG